MLLCFGGGKGFNVAVKMKDCCVLGDKWSTQYRV